MDRALDKPFSSSSDVIRCIRFEEELQLFRAKRGLPPNASEASAYTQMTVTAKGKEKARPFCANCKRSNHRTDFCVLPGGKMAGWSVKEARAAQPRASGKQPRGD